MRHSDLRNWLWRRLAVVPIADASREQVTLRNHLYVRGATQVRAPGRLVQHLQTPQPVLSWWSRHG
jgi:hypothetical protein